MQAERPRKVFGSKNRVNVETEPSQDDSKKQAEQSLPITKKELGPETDSDTTAPIEQTHLPITTQSTLQSTTAGKDNPKIQKGRQIASEGDYHKAITIFHGISPATFDSLYYCGCARLELGDQIQICRAIEDFNQALKLSPEQNDTNIYYKRAFACQRTGRYAEAIIDYTMYIQSNREHAHKGYLSRGLVYSEIKQNDKALDDITHANRLRQLPPKYYVYCMARAQASAGQYDKARATFTELADMCRNECNTSVQTFDTYFYYGIAEYELNNYPTALKHFSEALNYNPSRHDQADTIFYIGLTHYASGEMELAEKKFKDVLTLDENHARALFRIGLMQSQNDDLKTEAIKNLTKAHQLTPHKSEILYERGELHRKMGRLDASIHDKRLALQLERTDADPSVLKHYYEHLMQQLSSMIKAHSTLPNDLYLLFVLLWEKCMLERDANRKSVSDKDYHTMVSFCDQAIEKDPNGIDSVLYFAILCTLHENKKYASAAMACFNNLNFVLDKYPKVEEKWYQMLDEIREMKEKQIVPQSETVHYALLMANIQDLLSENNKEVEKMVTLLLAEKFSEFQKFNTGRSETKVDEEHFANDLNKNRSIFYTNIRSSLSHQFTAMAVTSGGGGGEPIIKHDLTGTQSNVADFLGLIGNILGAAMPTGGNVVSSATSLISALVKKNEYNRYQTRMSLIIEGRDIVELNDLARQVARELADRYEEQLLKLNPSFNEVPEVCCLCCLRCLRRLCPCCKDKDKSSEEMKPLQEKPPVQIVAEFGIAFAIQSIVEEKSEDMKISNGMKTIDLVKSIAEVICRAKPTRTARVLQRMHLDKNTVLPLTPLQNAKEGEKSSPWHLYDFYQKPGIYIINDNGQTPKKYALSWMNSDLYGYRLGTVEEYTHLVELDKKLTEKKSKICRCC